MSWVVIISTIAIGAGVATAGPAPSVSVHSVTVDTEAACMRIAKDFTGGYEVKEVTINSRARCYADGEAPTVSVPPPSPPPPPRYAPQVQQQRYPADCGGLHEQDDLVQTGRDARGCPTFEIVPHMPYRY